MIIINLPLFFVAWPSSFRYLDKNFKKYSATKKFVNEFKDTPRFNFNTTSYFNTDSQRNKFIIEIFNWLIASF